VRNVHGCESSKQTVGVTVCPIRGKVHPIGDCIVMVVIGGWQLYFAPAGKTAVAG
jgi:hypothetical protein